LIKSSPIKIDHGISCPWLAFSWRSAIVCLIRYSFDNSPSQSININHIDCVLYSIKHSLSILHFIGFEIPLSLYRMKAGANPIITINGMNISTTAIKGLMLLIRGW
jgi:hypothetical protein